MICLKMMFFIFYATFNSLNHLFYYKPYAVLKNTYLTLLIKRLLVVFLIYQLCRCLFIWFNYETIEKIDVNSFLGGMIFDMSAIGYVNLIFVLAHLLPGNLKYKETYQKALKLLFFAVNLVFITANLVDLEYYKFTGKRSTYVLITATGMENEIGRLLLSFIVEFWYIPFITVFLGALVWRALGHVKVELVERYTPKKYLKDFFVLVFFLGLAILAGRGGFGKKPLRIVDAILYNNQSPEVVLNTPFSILKTIGKNENLSVPQFYSEEELDSIYNPVIITNPESKKMDKNVVIIILESFGDENVQSGYTPFLDSLITESLYFKNGFANGRLSIDAVPSILSSIPSLMENSLITSSYSLNDVYGLPKILKENGYYTSFFHGAFNGSQNFDQYCKVAGFDDYFGKNEYIGPEAFDGRWGIFDEEFLQFFAQKIETFKQPFFSVLFTISSHNPYIIPEKYKGKFPKGTTKVMETIAYTDYALKQFFDSIKTEEWYQNTLFVITADHGYPDTNSEIYRTSVGRFEIPILFFDPSDPTLKGVSEKNLQQTDIMPSIVDYLNIKTKMISYGKSFTSDVDFVVYFQNNIYHYINGEYYLRFDGTNPIGLYKFKKDKMLKNNLLYVNSEKREEMTKFIKAYIQSFNYRVVNNKLIEK